MNTAGSLADPDPMDQIQRKKHNKKYLKIRKLTAQLRDKDLELAHILESKRMITNELMVTLHGEHVQKPIENPDYLNLVRERKEWDGVTQEQLLTYVLVSFCFEHQKEKGYTMGILTNLVSIRYQKIYRIPITLEYQFYR